MFRNYFKVAARSLWRNGKISVIHIVGLSVGIASCLIMLLYVKSELGYDRFNKKADRIVRVIFKADVGGQKIGEANVMPPVAASLKSSFPEVQQATRLLVGGEPVISYGNKSFKEDAFAYVDANFFQVFTLRFLEGDPRIALSEPNTIVITRAMAQKYFGKADPIGKVLDFKRWKTSFQVTGVIDEVPRNAHFHFDFFASMASWPDAKSASFMTSGYYTYLVLPAGYDYQKLQAKLPGFVDKYMGPQMQQGMGMTLSEFRKGGNQIGLYLQPLTAIHLHSHLTGELSPGGNSRYVYILGIIALFMLSIACINFMNLSTAGASRRAREIGVRKVLGSARSQLMAQFLVESILLTALSTGIALVLVQLTLPLFNNLSAKNLSLSLVSNAWTIPGLLIFILVIGFMAGGYPAFSLASFKPVSVLKGNVRSPGRTASLRNALVVFQFFVSITLIICTTVVYRQLRFMEDVDLGYNGSGVLVLPETWLLGDRQAAFRQQLLQDPGIKAVSVSGYLPAGPSYSNNFFVYPDSRPAEVVKTLRYDVDYQYIPAMEMQLASGRNFSRSFGTDSTGVIINQNAAKVFGWGASALGHTITRRENDGKETTYHVIGVVKDFHFRSLHELISPLVMVLGQGAGTMILKVKPGSDIKGVLKDVRARWDALRPGTPLTYSFLDDRIARTYRTEAHTGMLLGIFSGLAILIACLGLFGLMMYAAEQRKQEMGIRKVLGARVSDILNLMASAFVKWVLLAFMVAAPVAWWCMHRWLSDFAYRVQIAWWVFLLAGLVALAIAVGTVSFQVIKTALLNPVDALRTE